MKPDPTPKNDPVRARRAQIARVAETGQRLGYACYGLAIVLFMIAFLTNFAGIIVTTTVVALILGSFLLAPAILTSYMVKAAEREDRENGV
ncbi:MAG: hypothetical protein ABIR11_01535 [Candidatus Limnocylindrales bacterium]